MMILSMTRTCPPRSLNVVVKPPSPSRLSSSVEWIAVTICLCLIDEGSRIFLCTHSICHAWRVTTDISTWTMDHV